MNSTSEAPTATSFVVRKHTVLRGSFLRRLDVSHQGIHTFDLSSNLRTNSYAWDEIEKLEIVENSTTDFLLKFKRRNDQRFSCETRTELIGTFLETKFPEPWKFKNLQLNGEPATASLTSTRFSIHQENAIKSIPLWAIERVEILNEVSIVIKTKFDDLRLLVEGCDLNELIKVVLPNVGLSDLVFHGGTYSREFTLRTGVELTQEFVSINVEHERRRLSYEGIHRIVVVAQQVIVLELKTSESIEFQTKDVSRFLADLLKFRPAFVSKLCSSRTVRSDLVCSVYAHTPTVVQYRRFKAMLNALRETYHAGLTESQSVPRATELLKACRSFVRDVYEWTCEDVDADAKAAVVGGALELAETCLINKKVPQQALTVLLKTALLLSDESIPPTIHGDVFASLLDNGSSLNVALGCEVYRKQKPSIVSKTALSSMKNAIFTEDPLILWSALRVLGEFPELSVELDVDNLLNVYRVEPKMTRLVLLNSLEMREDAIVLATRALEKGVWLEELYEALFGSQLQDSRTLIERCCFACEPCARLISKLNARDFDTDVFVPDRIWNSQTRFELQKALKAEIDVAKNTADFSWNHVEFKVEYPSLKNELKVGSLFLRVLIESPNEILKISDPQDAWNRLYEAFLRRNVNTQTICEAMANLLSRCRSSIVVRGGVELFLANSKPLGLSLVFHSNRECLFELYSEPKVWDELISLRSKDAVLKLLETVPEHDSQGVLVTPRVSAYRLKVRSRAVSFINDDMPPHGRR